MGIKQKLLVGTLVGGSTCILIGSLVMFPPMIIVGGVAVGLSLRKRLLFKKKKKPKKEEKKEEKKEKKSFFRRKKKPEMEPGQAPHEQPFISKTLPKDLYSGKIDGRSYF